jgi:hypothetical protein
MQGIAFLKKGDGSEASSRVYRMHVVVVTRKERRRLK